jgi:hypothetical protein
MGDEAELKEILKGLFLAQRLAVLASNSAGYPYLNLVAFAATEDLEHLFFCTDRPTRKYTNLKADSRASMLIDSRSNDESDIHEAMAVSALGNVRDLHREECDEFYRAYLSKHPYLEAFARSPSSAQMVFDVGSYFIVRRFQNVSKLNMKP